MVTIEDLRNPKRKSGFDHVSSDFGNKRPKPYRAFVVGKRQFPGATRRSDRPGFWDGPRRETPEEAAQDYCDYINGMYDVGLPTALNYPGHATRPKDELPSEVQDALGVLRDHKAQRAGRQGYVYCIGERANSNIGYVKIGYSVNPEARVGELQTGNPRVLYLLAKMPGTEADERALHARFAHKNVVGEWFHGTYDVIDAFKGHYVV